MNVLGVCGSLQQTSSNLTLLRRAQRLAADRWADRNVSITIFDGLGRLPLFNPDLDGSCIPTVTSWRNAIASADALLIASPEYGHSLPGALKNAIDWVIGTAELENMIVAVTAATPHEDRGRLGLQALCQTLGAVSAQCIGAKPIVLGTAFDAQLVALLDEVVTAIDAPPA